MNWSYIAGFTDGEGYILNKVYTTREYSKNNGKWYSTTRLRRRIILTQSNKQSDVLYRIAEFLDEQLNTNIRVYDRNDGNSQLVIGKQQDTYRVAKKILKYSVVKNKKLSELLATYENPELLKESK